MDLVSRAGRVVSGATAVLVAALAGCGEAETVGHDTGPRLESSERDRGAQSERQGWTSYHDPNWGYTVTFPSGWHRARRSLTPSYTDPVEILSVATFPLREGDELCGDRGALARVPPGEALVTVQQRGRGAYGGSGFPPRPASFRPDLSFPACRPGPPAPPDPASGSYARLLVWLRRLRTCVPCACRDRKGGPGGGPSRRLRDPRQPPSRVERKARLAVEPVTRRSFRNIEAA